MDKDVRAVPHADRRRDLTMPTLLRRSHICLSSTCLASCRFGPTVSHRLFPVAS